MTRRIALLRGINVGGNRKLPMAGLRSAIEAAGATNVATYIQSGNVALETELSSAAAAQLVTQSIKSASGLTDVPVIMTTPPEVSKVISAAPFPTSEPKMLHVVFAAAGADLDLRRTVDADDIAPDLCQLSAEHIYLYTPNGLAKTKATHQMWEKVTGVACTLRNWNTVTKLADL